ncbi:hypothetical protein ACFQDN_21830 [Pseudomonas asuensis]
MKTLSEQAELRLTVALPTADDWQLLVDDKETKEQLVNRLNAVLVAALEFAKRDDSTWGQISEEIFPALFKLDAEFPNAGIRDSEGYLTVARFFAVNYSPAMYDFLRYFEADNNDKYVEMRR